MQLSNYKPECNTTLNTNNMDKECDFITYWTSVDRWKDNLGSSLFDLNLGVSD